MPGGKRAVRHEESHGQLQQQDCSGTLVGLHDLNSLSDIIIIHHHSHPLILTLNPPLLFCTPSPRQKQSLASGTECTGKVRPNPGARVR